MTPLACYYGLVAPHVVEHSAHRVWTVARYNAPQETWDAREVGVGASGDDGQGVGDTTGLVDPAKVVLATKYRRCREERRD